MKKTSAHVPATRGLKVANIIARAEVKGLVTEARSEAFLEMLEGADIDADTATFAHALSGTLQLAQRYKLSAYDASYLKLAANRKDKNGIGFGNVSVQGDITVRTLADHQFPLVVIYRAANQGIVLQHIDRLDDLPDARCRIFNLIPGQMIEDAVKVIPHLGRQLDSRHIQRASLRAVGRFACLSARRSSR